MELFRARCKRKLYATTCVNDQLFQITDFTSFIIPRLKDFKAFGVRLLFSVIEYIDWVFEELLAFAIIGVAYKPHRLKEGGNFSLFVFNSFKTKNPIFGKKEA